MQIYKDTKLLSFVQQSYLMLITCFEMLKMGRKKMRVM